MHRPGSHARISPADSLGTVVSKLLTARGGSVRPAGTAPHAVRRVASILADGFLLAAAVRIALGPEPRFQVIPAVAILWLVVRVLPLAAAGRTPGIALAGYRVLGPGGARLSLGRALLRETAPLIVVLWFALFLAAGLGGRILIGSVLLLIFGVALRGSHDRRMVHDLVADTWPVDVDGPRA